MKWECCQVWFKSMNDLSELNKHGLLGWELVNVLVAQSTVSTGQVSLSQGYYAIFKRQIDLPRLT